jgi:hypothetical protein
MKKKFTGLMAIGVVLLAGNTSSFAQSHVSYNTSTPIANSTTTDWDNPLTFQQFNPSLGTLDSVTLNLSGQISTVLMIQNNAASSSSGHDSTDVSFFVDDTDDNIGAASTPFPEMDPDTTHYDYSLAAGDSVTTPTLTGSGTFSQAYTEAAILTEFTGTGSFALDANTSTFTDLSNNGGNTSDSQTTQAGLTGSVEYTYTATAAPEPGTYSLLALGLFAGVPFLRRQRK